MVPADEVMCVFVAATARALILVGAVACCALVQPELVQLGAKDAANYDTAVRGRTGRTE
jgi:hypothetical protein